VIAWQPMNEVATNGFAMVNMGSENQWKVNGDADFAFSGGNELYRTRLCCAVHGKYTNPGACRRTNFGCTVVRWLTDESHALDNIHYSIGALVARIHRPCGRSLDSPPSCNRRDCLGCATDTRPSTVTNITCEY
jgi:hypothetical protein